MGYVEIKADNTGVSIVTFNSLYGIPLQGAIDWLWGNLVLSIPFMGYYRYNGLFPSHLINFQFPLWDTLYF